MPYIVLYACFTLHLFHLIIPNSILSVDSKQKHKIWHPYALQVGWKLLPYMTPFREEVRGTKIKFFNIKLNLRLCFHLSTPSNKTKYSVAWSLARTLEKSGIYFVHLNHKIEHHVWNIATLTFRCIHLKLTICNMFIF